MRAKPLRTWALLAAAVVSTGADPSPVYPPEWAFARLLAAVASAPDAATRSVAEAEVADFLRRRGDEAGAARHAKRALDAAVTPEALAAGLRAGLVPVDDPRTAPFAAEPKADELTLALAGALRRKGNVAAARDMSAAALDRPLPGGEPDRSRAESARARLAVFYVRWAVETDAPAPDADTFARRVVEPLTARAELLSGVYEALPARAPAGWGALVDVLIARAAPFAPAEAWYWLAWADVQMRADKPSAAAAALRYTTALGEAEGTAEATARLDRLCRMRPSVRAEAARLKRLCALPVPGAPPGRRR